MSQTSSGYTDQQQPPQQHGEAQNPLAPGYVLTEEEIAIFRECNHESFWYRSLPFSALAVSVTQVLVSQGVLARSPRLGSLPKVAFAAFTGYIAGKLSYTNTCKEKFKNVTNSPLGEALRRGKLQPQQLAPQNQSEMGDPNQMTYDPALQAATEPLVQGDSFSYSSDPSSSSYESAPFMESGPTLAGDDMNQQGSYLDEEKPRRRQILYEDLRSRNRETYEVTMTQKADTLLKPPAEAPAQRTDVKKNQYGDAWEE